jgi:hypothetical protein
VGDGIKGEEFQITACVLRGFIFLLVTGERSDFRVKKENAF